MQIIWLLILSWLSIWVDMLLGPVDFLVFISLITDMTSFLVAGFRKNGYRVKYRVLEIFVIGISVCGWSYCLYLYQLLQKKLPNVSAIILGLDSVLLFMFMDLICLWEFVLRLIIDLIPYQDFLELLLCSSK